MIPRRGFLALLATAPFSFSQTFENVERIVAVGDVHGDLDAFLVILRAAKLVDDRNAWIGGKSHLVVPGDFIDRGKASRGVMDLLMALEPQAQKAGGRVHALLGNHETMNMYGDLRYNVKADYDAFRTSKSESTREDAMEDALLALRESGKSVDIGAFRKQFQDEHPLGSVERAAAFSRDGKYGRWLRDKSVIIRINDLVFVHGGISPKYAGDSLKAINERIHAELDDPPRLNGGMTTDGDGPLWYRGYAEGAETDHEVSDALDQFLKRAQARHIVVGHTVEPAILPRFQGRVILIDVGLSEFYGGPPACLLVEDSKFYALHRGRQLNLPVDGGSLAPYLSTAAALEPPNSALRRLATRSGR